MAGPAEILVIVSLLLGGMGIPLGMPPQPNDPFMEGVAPEQCLVYSAWNGLAVPSADSKNEAERMLAEPEMQEFAEKVERAIRVVLAEKAVGNKQLQLVSQTIPDLVKLLLTQPTTIYIRSVGVGPEGPIVSGALVVKGDERLSATASRLRKIFALAADVEIDELEVRGTKFQRFALAAPIPPIFVGTHQGYLILATGDGAVHKLMARIGKDAPEWLVAARESLPIERRSTITYLDISRIQALGKLFGGPQISQMIQATALDDLTSIVSTSGMQGKGTVQTIRLNIKKGGRLMDLIGSLKPLTNDDFANIPADSAFAQVANFDLGKFNKFAQESANIVDPNAGRMIEQNLAEMEKQLGFNPRADLVDALGDRWLIYTSPDTGLFTGLVATVEVDDFQKLNRALFAVMRMAQADFSISSHIINETTIYTVIFNDEIAVSPSFALTDKELIVSLYPQPIRAHLTRPSGKTLANVESVAKALEKDSPPSSILYLDTKRAFELAYPFIQGTYSMMCNALKREGINLDPAMLPSAGAIHRHLDNALLTSTVVENGIVFERQQQFPGGSIGATTAFALGVTLPAVGAAQESAQRMSGSNNLKQLALAFHNYHDTFNGFPRDSYDAEGKPLLSWRVHILPFVDQQALYEQFHLDEPWDSEHNKKLIAQMPPTYAAPGRRNADNETVYLAPVSDDSIMPPVDLKNLKKAREFPVGIRLADIRDGTSNTIMIVEMNEELAVTWSKPQDFKINVDDPLKGLVGLRRGGFQASLCDGSVHFFSELMDEELLNGLFTRNGGEVVNIR